MGGDWERVARAVGWAVRERTKNGKRLLRENPLAGVRLPTDKNPRRPVMRHDEYLRLLDVADRVDSRLKLGLIVAEGTGRRLSAWRNLLWEDVDFDAGTICWRADHDKKGYEQVVPMTDAVKDALAAARRAQKSIGNTPVFPAPKHPNRPCSADLFGYWLRKAYELAEIAPQLGGMWHPIRRKWATERKGYPVKDVAAAGGWEDEGEMLKSYQQADPGSLAQGVLPTTQ